MSSHLIPLIRTSNWRVIVEPDTWLLPIAENEDEAMKRRCEEIVDNIRRHVDNVETAYVDCDTEALCPHCQRDWTPDDSLRGYNGCCDKERDAWIAAHKGDPAFVREVMGNDVIIPS